MRIEYLYRYPVKGLTAEALEASPLEAGQAMPWDRVFALALGDAPFDPAAPKFLPKRHFLSLMNQERAAELRASFDPRSYRLELRRPDGAGLVENARSPAGRASLAAFIADFIGPQASRGTPSLHHVPGHVFTDDERPVVSLIGLASLADLTARAGAPRHRLRFRANIYLSGVPAWHEFDWVGQEIQLGGARLRVLNRIRRCPAIEVDPETARRDADVLGELKRFYQHTDTGIFAEVLEGGQIAVGDALEVLPA
jgi:uncharacterized protein YcbX